MPIFDTIPNSATTLSINYRPGQNKRLLASKSEAIFSFGDFTIEKNYSLNYLTADTRHIQFGRFDTLQSLSAVNFSTEISIPYVEQNELNLPKKNPKSHSYFSSFYTNVANSINKIISDFPYAILSFNGGNTNVFDYAEYYDGITFEATSSFKIPVSGLTNQGNIILTSANTENVFSLPYDYSEFCIQLSATTSASAVTYQIKSYSLSGTYLQFEIYGYLKNNSFVSTYSDALYIRPTKERVYNYNKSISNLEKQLLNDGIFLVPAVDTIKDDSFEQTFKWPKTIDGFAPDTYGADFETYKENLLLAAEKIDEEKTDIFIKTVVPENYLELDSDGQIYRTIIQSYAYEFDKLKSYIDAMAYAHSVDYNSEETVPKKFLAKLSTLLGWKLADGFGELDLFDYLTSDVDQKSNSFSYFNVEIWKRILVNLVWLYKKKGTRDAITFIFKLLGAPDCLINFNEFVYDITIKTPNLTEKVDSDGYINYNSSIYAFQQGGDGRGNGDAYINQWRPEFNPVVKIDNRKVCTGDTTYGTRSIVNTKEADINLSPAKAIECDVFDFYKKDCSCWTLCGSCPSFSSLTVPYEYLTFDCDDVKPVNITAMTLSQYIDHVYMNSIEPTTRKTYAQCHTSWGYHELKNIYIAYYYTTYPANYSLSVCRLEAYLQLLELRLGDYVAQLVPSTTIFDDNISTTYKNPVFHRQRFVYREGIDRGSMFRRNFPDDLNPKLLYSYFNNAKICVFAGQSRMSNGLVDETGNTWRVARNISNSNICPSSKNRIGKISFQKNDVPLSSLRQNSISVDYITTRNSRLSLFKITCGINKNLVATSLGAVSVSTGEIGTTSNNVVTEQLFTF